MQRKRNRDGARKKFDRRKYDMEFWDIYDENKQPTGRTMKRNDFTCFILTMGHYGNWEWFSGSTTRFEDS